MKLRASASVAMQLSEQNYYNVTVVPRNLSHQWMVVATQAQRKNVNLAPGSSQVMKQEAAVRLEQYRSNEIIDLLKIIMHRFRRPIKLYLLLFFLDIKTNHQSNHRSDNFIYLTVNLCRSFIIVLWFTAWEWLNCTISPSAVMDFHP